MSLPQNYKTAGSRREFLASWLGAAVFWKPRNRRKLAGVDFERIRAGAGSRRYLLIHGNEETARQVLTEHMKKASGTAWLAAGHARNAPFLAGELDPNRMFSREGAERNLRALNPAWSEAHLLNGLLILDRTRRQLTSALRPGAGDVLIAVHNNRDYSVNDELAASNATALNDRDNPHEFCLCTDEGDFQLLSKGPYNVVLQNRPGGAEDGSMSRYAVRAGFRYANLEVAMGKAEKQRAMLEWLDRTLPAPRR